MVYCRVQGCPHPAESAEYPWCCAACEGPDTGKWPRPSCKHYKHCTGKVGRASCADSSLAAAATTDIVAEGQAKKKNSRRGKKKTFAVEIAASTEEYVLTDSFLVLGTGVISDASVNVDSEISTATLQCRAFAGATYLTLKKSLEQTFTYERDSRPRLKCILVIALGNSLARAKGPITQEEYNDQHATLKSELDAIADICNNYADKFGFVLNGVGSLWSRTWGRTVIMKRQLEALYDSHGRDVMRHVAEEYWATTGEKELKTLEIDTADKLGWHFLHKDSQRIKSMIVGWLEMARSSSQASASDSHAVKEEAEEKLPGPVEVVVADEARVSASHAATEESTVIPAEDETLKDTVRVEGAATPGEAEVALEEASEKRVNDETAMEISVEDAEATKIPVEGLAALEEVEDSKADEQPTTGSVGVVLPASKNKNVTFKDDAMEIPAEIVESTKMSFEGFVSCKDEVEVEDSDEVEDSHKAEPEHKHIILKSKAKSRARASLPSAGHVEQRSAEYIYMYIYIYTVGSSYDCTRHGVYINK